MWLAYKPYKTILIKNSIQLLGGVIAKFAIYIYVVKTFEIGITIKGSEKNMQPGFKLVIFKMILEIFIEIKKVQSELIGFSLAYTKTKVKFEHFNVKLKPLN